MCSLAGEKLILCGLSECQISISVQRSTAGLFPPDLRRVLPVSRVVPCLISVARCVLVSRVRLSSKAASPSVADLIAVAFFVQVPLDVPVAYEPKIFGFRVHNRKSIVQLKLERVRSLSSCHVLHPGSVALRDSVSQGLVSEVSYPCVCQV